MNSPLSAADCYHTGIVVPDLDAAAKRLTTVAGYRWTRPMEYTLPVTTPDGELDIPFRLTYSLQAPHLELVQEVPGTIWTAAGGNAPHHLGYWVDDIASASEQLELAGFAREVSPSGDGPPTFAYHIDPGGVRIEIVARALFPDWPGFLNSMAE